MDPRGRPALKPSSFHFPINIRCSGKNFLLTGGLLLTNFSLPVHTDTAGAPRYVRLATAAGSISRPLTEPGRSQNPYHPLEYF